MKKKYHCNISYPPKPPATETSAGQLAAAPELLKEVGVRGQGGNKKIKKDATWAILVVNGYGPIIGYVLNIYFWLSLCVCGYFSRICQAVSNSATGCPSYLSFRICWHCLQVEAQWSSTNYKILHVQIAAKTQWSAFCKKTKGTLHIIQQLQVTTRCCTGIIFFWTKVSIVPNDDAESCNLYFSHVHRQSSWYQSIGKWPIIQNINLIGQRCYAFLSTTLFKGRVEGRRPHLHRSTWARHLRHTWARHLRHTWAWQWFTQHNWAMKHILVGGSSQLVSG